MDIRTNLPFYIGKGKKSNNRHLDHFKESIDKNSNRHKFFKINYLQKLRLEIPVIILVDNVKDEIDAYEIETSYILKYGRENIDAGGILVNILLNSRIPPSAKGKKQTKEHKAKRSASRQKTISEYGMPTRSADSKKRMSDMMKGDKNHFYGKTHSVEFSKQQSKMMKGNQYNARNYKFVSPTGETYIVTGFAKFCREHNLSISVMEKGMYAGKWALTGPTAGWKVKKREE
jgi:hypothetical protein